MLEREAGPVTGDKLELDMLICYLATVLEDPIRIIKTSLRHKAYPTVRYRKICNRTSHTTALLRIYVFSGFNNHAIDVLIPSNLSPPLSQVRIDLPAVFLRLLH